MKGRPGDREQTPSQESMGFRIPFAKYRLCDVENHLTSESTSNSKTVSFTEDVGQN